MNKSHLPSLLHVVIGISQGHFMPLDEICKTKGHRSGYTSYTVDQHHMPMWDNLLKKEKEMIKLPKTISFNILTKIPNNPFTY